MMAMMSPVLILLSSGLVSLCFAADDVCSEDVCKENEKAAALFQSRLKVVRDAPSPPHHKSNFECPLFERDILQVDGTEEVVWDCKFPSGEMKDIVGLTDSWISANSDDMISGRSILKISEAVIGRYTVTVPAGVTPTVELPPVDPGVSLVDASADPVNGNTPVWGDWTLLIVRVLANDCQSSHSQDQLADLYFGAGGSQLNVAERFQSCSFGNFKVKPFVGKTDAGADISGGVVDVVIDLDVNGFSAYQTYTDMIKAIKGQLGSLKQQADAVVVNTPANSPTFSIISWAGQPFTMIHDAYMNEMQTGIYGLGRMIKLVKADDAAYGANQDSSGWMCFSRYVTQSTQMCFNSAANWQLGWYPHAYATATPLQQSWNGQLVGVARYGDWGIHGKHVSVKMDIGTPVVEYFVSFNHARGINSGTLQGGDKVLVHKQEQAATVLVATLQAGETFSIAAGQSTVIVEVKSIDSGNAGYAEVAIYDAVNPPTAGPSTTAPDTTTRAPPRNTLKWIIGERGHSCDQACQSLGSTCAISELQFVDSEANMLELEKQSGLKCAQKVPWSYKHSPSVCTGAGCCRPWGLWSGCTNYCTFGSINGRSCSETAESKYQRFCPCVWQ